MACTRPQAMPFGFPLEQRGPSLRGRPFPGLGLAVSPGQVRLEGGPGHHPGAEPISVALEPAGDGHFSGPVPKASAGTLYRYRLDRGTESYPDAASRFQPHGPYSPSQVIDPGAFQWHDQGWFGVPLEGQVIYEIHVGTYTPAGTWEAAMGELPALAELGVTMLEIMPIADFSGRFGWGYDGVNLFAPTRLYSTPDDCRRFIDQAHALGLGVILDVVYNHLGPDGNFLAQFSPEILRITIPQRARRLTMQMSMPDPCVSFSSRMPATGSRSSTWTDCGWTPHKTSTTNPPCMCWLMLPKPCGTRRAAGTQSSLRKTNRSRPSSCGLKRRVVMESMPCGTTIFHHSPQSLL